MQKNPQLQQPPPGVPIAELRTADHTQTFFRELVDRTSPRWQLNNPIKRGTLYSSLQGADVEISKAFPQLYFLTETVPIGSNTVAGMTQSDWVVWSWCNDPDSESTYNAEVTYLADAVTNPVLARVYTIRRDEYNASPSIATGSPLTALIGVEITNGGAGYKTAQAIFDCDGENAEVDFVISDGVIISAIVTKEGSGFSIGTQMTIEGDGSGATGIPLIQPVAAILTSQKKTEFDDSDPMSHEFVRVTRVYELLPGPYVPFTRYDDDLGPIQGRRRAVFNTGQQGGAISPTGYLNYTGRDGSSVVLIEIQENFSNGTGTPGNPIYPILRWETYTDERGNVYHISQIVVATGGEFASFVRSGTDPIVTVTKTWFEPYADNPFLLKKFVDKWTEVLVHDRRILSEFGGGETAITERTQEPGSQDVEGGLLIVSDTLQTKSPNEQTRRTEKLSGASAWPVLQGIHTDEVTGIVVDFTKQVIDAGTPYPGRTGCGGPFIEDQPYDRWKTIRIASKVDLNTLPAAETWVTTRPFNLPPTLLSVEAIWSDVVGKSAGATENANQFGVALKVNSGATGGIVVTAKNGFRGYAVTRVTRQYFFCHPPESQIFQPQKIIPSSGSVILTDTSASTFFEANDDQTGPIVNTQFNASSNNGGTVGDQFSRQISALQIHDHLVGFFDIINGSHTSPHVNAGAVSGGGRFAVVSASGTLCTMEVRIPQSTPASLVSGQQILTEFEVEQGRFNIWTTLMYVTTIP